MGQQPELWDHLQHIRVFARMTPQGKADVIKALQKHELKVIMCGDGGNDMGALKQADVGLALFSGYGNMNADSEGDKNENGETNEAKPAAGSTAEASSSGNDVVVLATP